MSPQKRIEKEELISKKKPRQSKKKFVFLPFVGLLFGLLLAFIYVNVLGYRSIPGVSPIPQLSTRPTATPTPTPGPKPVSVLLLGYGGPDHDGGYLTDTIIEVVVQPQEKRILMITIPRDLSVGLPVNDSEKVEEKINAAFAIGIDDKNYPNKAPQFKASTNPGALAKKVVGDITGFPVDNFLALSFNGFVKAIDTLGGIDVYFDQTFDDYRYPIRGKENETCGRSAEEIATLSASLKGDELESQFPCRYEHLHADKGIVHLSGEEALKIARSRHSVNLRGDFSRSERQRNIIQAAKEKVFQIGFLPKAIPFFSSLGKDLITDINVSFLASLVPYAQDLRSYKIIPIALSDQNVLAQSYNGRGQYVLAPKSGSERWDELQSYIQLEATKSSEVKEATPSGKIQ